MPSSLRLVLYVLLILSCSGCVATRESVHSAGELTLPEGGRVHSVVLKDGSVVRFDDNGGSCVPVAAGSGSTAACDAVVGITSEGAVVEVAARDILEVHVRTRETDTVGTVVMSSLGVLFAGLMLVLLYLSQW